MANPYFQFKQFRIQQGRTAMKVCTDACVLGAYTNASDQECILDIGTGTGLLALMLAQRNTQAHIDAIEIDQDAYEQAVENVARSPWNDRIRVIHQRIQDFMPADKMTYDLIISNPPFYQNHLKRSDHSQNTALHSEALTLAELAQAVHHLLHPEGRFTVMLPLYQMTELAKMLASFNLSPISKLLLYDYVGGKQIRQITTYGYQVATGAEEELYIKDAAGAYTSSFVQLLAPYYLYL